LGCNEHGAQGTAPPAARGPPARGERAARAGAGRAGARCTAYCDSLDYTLIIDPDAADRVQINLPAATGYEEDIHLAHGTRSPSVFVFQDTELYPQGNTAWHYHPGIVLITVAEGSVEWYDAKCTRHVRSAGDFFTESDQLHFVRNISTAPARMILTFIIPKGVTNKIYAPAPPCAAALGLN
jgi:quercetin dioxygenase-like cupin family protein